MMLTIIMIMIAVMMISIMMVMMKTITMVAMDMTINICICLRHNRSYIFRTQSWIHSVWSMSAYRIFTVLNQNPNCKRHLILWLNSLHNRIWTWFVTGLSQHARHFVKITVVDYLRLQLLLLNIYPCPQSAHSPGAMQFVQNIILAHQAESIKRYHYCHMWLNNQSCCKIEYWDTRLKLNRWLITVIMLQWIWYSFYPNWYRHISV